ncbi:MAG: SBBP repeat-containing protein [Candidatus Hydrothermales bacterium]
MMKNFINTFLILISFNSLKANLSITHEEKIENLIGEYMGFERNLGQIKDFEGKPINNVLLTAKLKGYRIFITKSGVSYVIYKPTNSKLECARIDVELVGADIKGENMEFFDVLPGYSNYYLPPCPEGILGVMSYEKVKIKNIYPGVDWLWKYEDKKLHHEFEIKKGADISKIRIRVKGAEVNISKNRKKLIFSTPIGIIEDGDIKSYGKESLQEVEVFYKKDSKNEISFEVKNFNKKEDLIIDPPLSLLWGTYYGGNSFDYGYSVKIDGSGNVFVTGHTLSTDFPTFDPGTGGYYDNTHNGQTDVFILKFNNLGIRQWATYYGGNNYDESFSLAVDVSGNIFITGRTQSTDFPTYNPPGPDYYDGTHNGLNDVFILKFNNQGVRLWATFYGGNSHDEGFSITVDGSNNIFLTGSTFSTDFPTDNPGGGAYYQGTNSGYWDAFILKFSNQEVRLWATYYGGSAYDHGISITVDGSGNIFITGTTQSTNFPTYFPGGGTYFQGVNYGDYDGFILKFNNQGVRLWATYYGGNAFDTGESITIDGSGNVYVGGTTLSFNFPTYNPGGGAYYQSYNAGDRDVFILKFNNLGARKWATYYGGGGDDRGESITVDGSGKVYLTGYTRSTNFPIYNPGGGAYFQAANAGYYDAFFLRFSNTGVRAWATYYGGSDDDYGQSITTDGSNNIFVTGFTGSSNFPTYNPGGGAYYQGTYAGIIDAYILKFERGAPLGEYDTNPKFKLSPIKIEPEILSISSFLKDNLTIKFLKPLEEKMEILIYNSTFDLVYSLRYPSNYSVTISDEKLKNLRKGIYFLYVLSGKRKIGPFKIIKID